MSTEKEHNLLLNSKIAVALGLVVLLVLGLALFAQGLVDKRNYHDEIVSFLEAQTKKKVTIKGYVRASLLPSPTLFISGIELHEPDSDNPVPVASVNSVNISATLMSVLHNQPVITQITLERPVIQVIRTEDKSLHLEWLNLAALKSVIDSKNSVFSFGVSVNNGRAIYHDNNTDKTTSLDNVNFSLSNGSSLTAQGGVTIYGHDIKFSLTKDVASAAGNITPFHWKLTSGESDFIEWKGQVDTTKEVPEFKGELALDLIDASIWLKPKQQNKQKFIDVVTERVSNNRVQKIPLPLKINGNWSQNGFNVLMDNFHMEGLNSVGNGKLKLSWNEVLPKVNLDMEFSTLDIDQWRKYFSAAFTRPKSDIYSKVYHGDDEIPENPLAGNIDLSINFIAQKVKFGNQTWGNGRLAAVMADSAITVNQFTIELPGETSLAMFGVITPSSNNDLRFEGSMETKGKSLREMMTVFDDSASGLPETGLGNFSIRSNIFVSSEQLRLSDADVKLKDLHLNGGLVAYFDSFIRLEADLKLKNINFDYFRDVWRTKKQKVKDADFFLKFDKSVDFNWLKKLQATIDFRVNVEHFTFFDHDGDSASFRIYARSGDLGIYDINFVYPTDIMKGHFKLNVNGEQPLIDMAMSVGLMDTAYFNVEPLNGDLPSNNSESKIFPRDQKKRSLSGHETVLASNSLDIKPLNDLNFQLIPQAETVVEATQAAPPPISTPAADEPVVPPKPLTGLDDMIKKSKSKTPQAANAIYKRWSEDLIDMSWMNGISGIIDLNVGKLMHKGLTFENLKLQTKFSNNLMIFNTLSFSYWGGQCSILGSLYGGKVPGFVITVSMLEMHLDQMLKDLIGRENVYGNVSINMSLNTSGVNMISWVTQAEGKMVVVGRGVTVQGINIPAVVEAVSVSRTASDVVNSVGRRLVDGATTFSVDGNVNLKNGMLRTPGIGLKSDAITGDLVGEVKLINWTMDLSTMFQFPELSSETIPTMSVQLAGPLKSGEMRSDTSSLEAYVAKRIISK